ncbi:hypothetical protein PPSIR1_14740 [Plesiocystis pacifica SIR-1]|uniref:Uncharacterized protein n=1 Tax=Plesiocystis pacifica SIR-1 TaxID=391625 RepID=A6GIS8_9BACT|nr:hypothetical protein [Plesiocystis pacifica]EDM74223.1 hypothetical protein PPSIR1_14740 [Plesiocystis pacifica SIR-1]
MPAPQKGTLEPIVQGLLAAAQLTGENQGDLAAAIAETWAGALDQLVQQAQVAPGIACPPGASAAPGRLM